MKKIALLFTAALLVTGAAFADGGKKKHKAACGKTCSKQDMKSDKANTPAPAPQTPPKN